MNHYLDQLIVYRNINSAEILKGLASVFKRFNQGSYDPAELVSEVNVLIHRLLDIATQYGFNQNLWHNYLAYLVAMTENPFSLTCERVQAREGSVNRLAMNDFKVIKDLFDYDFGPIEAALNINCFSTICNYQALDKDQKKYNKHVSDKVRMLSASIENAFDEKQVFDAITDFYRLHGVGQFGLNKAFRLIDCKDGLQIEPITNTVNVNLDDLVGYEDQKRILVDNTQAFIKGLSANNLLLYGDSGTGKSTCIKAILNQYYDSGLRLIEIYKHQFKHLSTLISRIKNRNYRFIIYMDDLSFEDFETEYKYLKAVIEGGVEITPENILIYATSNRRHLIKETWSDRSDANNENEIHHSDTAEEKMSLVNRFGITVQFFKPSRDEYLEIVKGIARRHPEITLNEEELVAEAMKWGNWHGNISGRRAQQFINYLLGQSRG